MISWININSVTHGLKDLRQGSRLAGLQQFFSFTCEYFNTDLKIPVRDAVIIWIIVALERKTRKRDQEARKAQGSPGPL